MTIIVRINAFVDCVNVEESRRTEIEVRLNMLVS